MVDKDTLSKKDVWIAGRKYPLRVTADEAARLQDIEADIHKEINDIQIRYADRDRQDSLAMALLSYAMRYHQAQHSLDAVDQGLSQIESQLSDT